METPATGQNWQVPAPPGSQRRSILSPLVQSVGWGSRLWLLVAEAGDGLSCFHQICQQGVHTVSSWGGECWTPVLLVEDLRGAFSTGFTGHVHRKLMFQHDRCSGGGNDGSSDRCQGVTSYRCVHFKMLIENGIKYIYGKLPPLKSINSLL